MSYEDDVLNRHFPAPTKKRLPRNLTMLRVAKDGLAYRDLRWFSTQLKIADDHFNGLAPGHSLMVKQRHCRC